MLKGVDKADNTPKNSTVTAEDSPETNRTPATTNEIIVTNKKETLSSTVSTGVRVENLKVL